MCLVGIFRCPSGLSWWLCSATFYTFIIRLFCEGFEHINEYHFHCSFQLPWEYLPWEYAIIQVSTTSICAIDRRVSITVPAMYKLEHDVCHVT